MEDFIFDLFAGYVDENGIIHKEVEIRELVGADEEEIGKYRKFPSKMLRVLAERCTERIGTISKRDVPKDRWTAIIQSLLNPDLDLLIMKIREVSMGEVFTSLYHCPNTDCGAKIEVDTSLADLSTNPFDGRWEVEFELPREFEYKGKVLKKGKIRRVNGLDREILDKFLRENSSKLTTLMMVRCVTFEGNPPITEDLFQQMPMRLRNHILDAIKSPFGLELIVDVMCPNCGEEFKAQLNQSENFI